MAGILANSASQVMVSGDTAVTKAVTGYVLNEQITLTAFPVGTTYVWSQTKPAASATDRSGLTSTTSTGPTFVPDAAGTYLVTCNVDGTAYTITIAVVAVSTAETLQTFRFLPVTDASVPTPTLSDTLYFSDDSSALGIKKTDGVFYPLALSGAPVVGSSTRLISTDSPYTVLATDDGIFCDTDGGAITVLLPVGITGTAYSVINTGSAGNAVTLTPNGAQEINGAAASQTITDGNSATVKFETTEHWWTI